MKGSYCNKQTHKCRRASATCHKQERQYSCNELAMHYRGSDEWEELSAQISTENFQRILTYQQKEPQTWEMAIVQQEVHHYGRIFNALLENLEDETLHYLVRVRFFFDQIKNLDGDSGCIIARSIDKSILDALTPELGERLIALPIEAIEKVLLAPMAVYPFIDSPESFLDTLERYGPFAKHFLTRVDESGWKAFNRYESKDRVRLLRFRDHQDLCLKSAFVDFLEAWELSEAYLLCHGDEIESLCANFGKLAFSLHALHFEDVFSLGEPEAEVYQAVYNKLVHLDLDDIVDEVFKSLTFDLLEYRYFLLFVLDTCQDFSSSIFDLLNGSLLERHQDEIRFLLDECRVHARKPLEAFVHFLEDHKDYDKKLLRHLMRCCPDSLDRVLTHLSYEELQARKNQYTTLASKYGNLFGELCKIFGSDLLQEEPKYRETFERAIDLYGELAGEYLYEVKQSEWSDQIETAYSLFGPAAPRIFHAGFSAETVSSGPDSEFARVRERCRDEFGIHNFQRFVGKRKKDANSELEYDLLRMGLKNLDPRVESEKPLGVVLVAESDKNRAFDSRRLRNLIKGVSEEFKLFIFEIRDVSDVDAAMQKVVRLHNTTEEEEFSKLLSFVLFCGHANAKYVLLSRRLKRIGTTMPRLEFVNGSLFWNDVNTFRRWSKFLHPEAYFIWHSCSVAQGGLDAQNVVATQHSVLPGLNVDAARHTCALSASIQDKEGRFLGVQYDYVPENKVLRIRGGKQTTLQEIYEQST